MLFISVRGYEFITFIDIIKYLFIIKKDFYKIKMYKNNIKYGKMYKYKH